MKKKICMILIIIFIILAFTKCSTQQVYDSQEKPIIFIWYPNASTRDLEGARTALGIIVEKATNRKVKHQLTTDYAILIEALANDKADLCLAGLQTTIEVNSKNPSLVPMVIPSGPSGTLEDAMYYSWLAVKTTEASDYLQNGNYSLDSIAGKRMAFVSTSSTSGFKVPSGKILSHFRNQDKWSNLQLEDLMESGENHLFSQVLFSGSHQVACVNLLSGKSDISAFADIVFNNYGDLLEGEPNLPGAVYQIKDSAAEPFHTCIGKTFTLIASIPVPNDHLIMNKNTLTEEEQRQLIEAFTSTEVANDTNIFLPEGSNQSGFLEKTKNECFLAVDDDWFQRMVDLIEPN